MVDLGLWAVIIGREKRWVNMGGLSLLTSVGLHRSLHTLSPAP